MKQARRLKIEERCRRGYVTLFYLGVILLVACMCFAPSRVWAVEDDAETQRAVDAAQASLQQAEADMAILVAEGEDLQSEIDALQHQIDETADLARNAQKEIIAGRESLGKIAAYEYRTDSFSLLLALLLDSQDVSDLMRNLTYLDSIMQYQADEIATQKERSAEFDKLVGSLNFQKDEQVKKLGQLEEKRAQAEQVVVSASSSLQNAQNDQAARIAALKEKANAMAKQGVASEPAIDEGATTPDRGDAVAPDAPVLPNPDPAPPSPAPEPSPSPEPAPDPGVSWSSGIASAYGGSTDSTTPNPGTTATGAVCDDNSMGVAIPLSWPQYWQYYGRTVEISYNGMTVFATVNDCGGMNGGKRVLDLQPGVWKAFGATSCQEWGIRTVSYRFL